jgi:hypothetical protein
LTSEVIGGVTPAADTGNAPTAAGCSPKEPTMTAIHPQALAQRYIDCWNETDPARRRDLLGTWWAPEARYADPLADVQGLAQIDALIGEVQQRFPRLRFTLRGRVDHHGDALRFGWQLGPEGGDSLVEGTDFAELDAGRLLRVTGFLDKLPT